MANKKMAAQSRGRLQKCDWEGASLWPPGYNASNVFARFERITLEHGRFTNSKSRSDE